VLRKRFQLHCVGSSGFNRRSERIGSRPRRWQEQVEGIAVVHDACSGEPAWVFGTLLAGTWAWPYAVAHPLARARVGA